MIQTQILRSLPLLLLASLLPACGGAEGRATPTTVYRGRPNEVTIDMPGASFSDKTSVSVSEGAKITERRAVTRTQLAVTVDVPLDLSAKELGLTADGLDVSLSVDDALAPSPAAGWILPQGGAGVVELQNRVAAHPLDINTLAIDAGEGVDVFVDERSPSQLTLTLHALPQAAVGPHDLLVQLLDGKGEPFASSRIAGAMVVEERTITPLPAGMPLTVTVPPGEDGAFLSFPGAAGKLLDLRVTAAKSGGQDITPYLAVLSPEKGLTVPLSTLTGDELLWPVEGDVLLYVGPLDAFPDKPSEITVVADLITPVPAAEKEPNEEIATANGASLPALISAELLSDEDKDVFALDVPSAGTLLVRTLPGPMGEVGDTYLRVEDAGGVVLGENDDEDPATNSALSFVRAEVQPGKVYIHANVGFGGFGVGAPYRIAAALR